MYIPRDDIGASKDKIYCKKRSFVEIPKKENFQKLETEMPENYDDFFACLQIKLKSAEKRKQR